MKNKRVLIAQADINAKTVQEVDIPITYSGTTVAGNVDLKTYSPIELRIYNDCGAGVEYNVIKNDAEYADYLVNSGTNYDFIRVPKTVLEKIPCRFPEGKLLVRGYETSASASLTLEFINYIE
jgi:intein-encoded DNA endonuclease-like protein